MGTKWKAPGLLAICVASVLALSGAVSAASATASLIEETPGTPCSGANIKGQGSSLQKIAQESVWIPGFATVCTNGLTVEYETSSSGKGRAAWGAEAPGHSPSDGTGENPEESGDAFIGTDEPLGSAQISNLNEAAGGTGQTIVIPVAQASVAVIVHPPAGCTPTEITNASLQKVWNGETLNREDISPKPSGSCDATIKRVVRKDVSGTTYVFKTYLSEISDSALECVDVGTDNNWSELSEPANNKTWPTTCEAHTLSPLKEATNNSGGGEVEEVAAVEGSIGYANLGDARKGYAAGKLEWLQVQNNGIQESKPAPTYAWPGTAATEPGATAAKANCETTNYGSKIELEESTGSPEADDNWSSVKGTNPDSTPNYPICTLTYDVALRSYFSAGVFTPGSGHEEEEANEVGTTAHDYLTYVVDSSMGGGQKAVANGYDYDALPLPVEELAEELASLIN